MSDHSADSFDNASVTEQAFRDAALAASRKAEKPPADFDGVHCTDCEGGIPLQRLELGKFRCVGCQTAFEKMKKFFRG